MSGKLASLAMALGGPKVEIEIESGGNGDVEAGLEAAFAEFAAALKAGKNKEAMMSLKDFVCLCQAYGE